MDCPKCTGILEIVEIGNDHQLHRCNSCYGIWSQPEALAALRNEWMSEAIVDVGNPRIGSKLDTLENVHCPVGHGAMTKHADPEQPHIWYEQCDTCAGIFLDAGEFTDLKFKTLLDWVRGIMLKF